LEKKFKKLLSNWYKKQSRNLPFRGSKNPWEILVSEIMLQQTTMETVLKRYQGFLEDFPTIESMAKSTEQEALKAWEGLGYYRRVKNLRKTAIVCYEKLNNQLPKKYSDLIKLPGIGKYTAAAISSICHKEKIAAIDGNVIRVVSRIFALEKNTDKSDGLKEINHLSSKLLDKRSPGDHNQAMMDLGAIVCTPKNPKCLSCPVSKLCKGFYSGDATKYPIKNKKRNVPEVDVAIASIIEDGKILLVQRPKNTMLEGLWELPGGKIEKNETVEQACLREVDEETGMSIKIEKKIGIVKHAYTHLKVVLHIFSATIQAKNKKGSRKQAWANVDNVNKLPIPTGTKKALSIIRK